MVGENKKRGSKIQNSSTSSSPMKLSKEEVFNNAVAFEEKEEQKFNRDQFRACFAEMTKLVQEVSELKSKEMTADIKKKIAEKRVQGSLIVVKMKKLNRLDKIRLANRRESLAKEKINVDSNRLKLQNLIYEADHLKKEINKCISFKSEDEDIELVPLEEFLEKASEDSRKPEVLDDKHQLRMRRLEFELRLRKEYAEQCKELEKSKEDVAQKIISVRDNLDSLEPCLQNICKSTRPVQKLLNMNFEAEWETEKIVRLLPQPLFMAYTKLVAYSEVIDKNLVVSIDGNEDEALQLEIERKRADEIDAARAENDDSDNAEVEENDFEELENRRKIQRRQSRVDFLNQKRQKLFSHHPLSVQFQLRSKLSQEVMSVTLNYLPEMEIVTVQGKFNIENASVAAGDIMTQDRILNSLYPDDLGYDSPNPKTAYQLQNLQVNSSDFNKTLEEKMLGKPYIWAQRLCGINFQSKLNVDESCKSSDPVPSLIRLMRKKIKARCLLYQQIQSLEIGKMTCSGNVRISSILQQFVSLSFSEYTVMSGVKKFVEAKIVASSDLFYRAIITRGAAKLECYIAVPGEFPNSYPIFAMELSFDNKQNADNSSHIREIEGFVNSIQVDKIDNILPLQLQRAMTSLDIFLETDSIQHQDANKEFQQSFNFSCSFRGRERSRPYQPVHIGATTSFKHIKY